VATLRQVCTLYREASERAERVLSTDEITGVQALERIPVSLRRRGNRRADPWPVWRRGPCGHLAGVPCRGERTDMDTDVGARQSVRESRERS
jgi:hypothetical protein